MRIYSPTSGKDDEVIIALPKKEAQDLILILACAMIAGKSLNKQSNAYKLAKRLDDEMPVF